MNKLRELRKQRGLTQSKFSDLFKIDQTTLSTYELGKRQMPDDLKIKVANYFNVSIDYLLGANPKIKIEERIDSKANYYPTDLKLAADERLIIGGDGTKHIVKISPDKKRIVEATLDIDLDHSNIDDDFRKKN